MRIFFLLIKEEYCKTINLVIKSESIINSTLVNSHVWCYTDKTRNQGLFHWTMRQV